MKKPKITAEELAYHEARLERLRAYQRGIAAEIEARKQRPLPQPRRWRRLLGLG